MLEKTSLGVTGFTVTQFGFLHSFPSMAPSLRAHNEAVPGEQLPVLPAPACAMWEMMLRALVLMQPSINLSAQRNALVLLTLGMVCVPHLFRLGAMTRCSKDVEGWDSWSTPCSLTGDSILGLSHWDGHGNAGQMAKGSWGSEATLSALMSPVL